MVNKNNLLNRISSIAVASILALGSSCSKRTALEETAPIFQEAKVTRKYTPAGYRYGPKLTSEGIEMKFYPHDEEYEVFFDGEKDFTIKDDKKLYGLFEGKHYAEVKYVGFVRSTYEDLDGDGKREKTKTEETPYTKFLSASPIEPKLE